MFSIHRPGVEQRKKLFNPEKDSVLSSLRVCAAHVFHQSSSEPSDRLSAPLLHINQEIHILEETE